MKRISQHLDLEALYNFLPCKTPDAWVQSALQNLDILLIDHAHCEKKAASTALSLMYRYPQYPELLMKLSKLAREELRHFEQVLKIMKAREIPYKTLPAARYAQALHTLVRKQEPYRVIDQLLIGAIIEARSCERFAAVAPFLDEELNSFYIGLLASEARHFSLYLNFAKSIMPSDEDLSGRIQLFLEKEKELIESPDRMFRFHSGILI